MLGSREDDGSIDIFVREKFLQLREFRISRHHSDRLFDASNTGHLGSDIDRNGIV